MKAGERRALRDAAPRVRCPECRRAGSLRIEYGHRYVGCWSCGHFCLVPEAVLAEATAIRAARMARRARQLATHDARTSPVPARGNPAKG